MSGPGFFRKPFPITAKKVNKVTPKLPTLAAYYTNELNRIKQMSSIDDQLLTYVLPGRQAQLKNQFAYTQSLLKTQSALNYNPELTEKLLDCAYFLKSIDNSSRLSFEKNKKAVAEAQEKEWNKLTFIQKMDSYWDNIGPISADFATLHRDEIISMNSHRLYWVWGGCLVSALDSIFDANSLASLRYYQSIYSYGIGFVSFYYYFDRFALECYLLMRNVFGPWTEEEAKLAQHMHWEDRLAYYLNERKSLLINDFFWSIANCLCTVVLVGKEFLSDHTKVSFGDLGNYVTASLLLLDVMMAFIALEEGKKNHRKKMKVLSNELIKLKEKFQKIQNDLAELEKTYRKCKKDLSLLYRDECYIQLCQVREEIREQEKIMHYAEFEWEYQKISLEINLGYACLLLLSFLFVCSILSPAAAVPGFFASSFFLVGSLCSFSLNVGAESLNRYFAGKKVRKEIAYLEGICQDLVQQFNYIARRQDAHLPLFQRELAYRYLDIAALYAEKINKEKKWAYQQAIAVVKSVAQTLLPGLLLLAFSTLTAGYAVLVVLSVMTVIFLIYMTIKHLEPTWFCRNMHALSEIQGQQGMLRLAHFDNYMLEKENHFFKNIWQDVQTSIASILPKWLIFICPPLTLTLLLFAVVYFSIKNCLKEENPRFKMLGEQEDFPEPIQSLDNEDEQHADCHLRRIASF